MVQRLMNISFSTDRKNQKNSKLQKLNYIFYLNAEKVKKRKMNYEDKVLFIY